MPEHLPAPPKDPDKFKAANKEWVAGLRKHALTGESLPLYGTNVLTNVINEAGAYPTNNFATGRFDGAGNISGETQAETENARGGEGSATHGCHRGCVIRCSGTFYDKDGNYVTKQPEYETVWAHGGNCGIDDLDAIAQIDRLDDDFGVDTIEMGATIGVAMEAGIAKFGDAQAAIELVKEVGKGTPLGRILGSGAGTAGKVFGVERSSGCQKPGYAGLRSACRAGHRSDLCHDDTGGRPHRRLCRHRQRAQCWRGCRRLKARRTDGTGKKPSDSNRHPNGFNRNVFIHRFCDSGSTGYLRGPGRFDKCFHRPESHR